MTIQYLRGYEGDEGAIYECEGMIDGKLYRATGYTMIHALKECIAKFTGLPAY